MKHERSHSQGSRAKIQSALVQQRQHALATLEILYNPGLGHVESPMHKPSSGML
jgi:hypothetical protein